MRRAGRRADRRAARRDAAAGDEEAPASSPSPAAAVMDAGAALDYVESDDDAEDSDESDESDDDDEFAEVIGDDDDGGGDERRRSSDRVAMLAAEESRATLELVPRAPAPPSPRARRRPTPSRTPCRSRRRRSSSSPTWCGAMCDLDAGEDGEGGGGGGGELHAGMDDAWDELAARRETPAPRAPRAPADAPPDAGLFTIAEDEEVDEDTLRAADGPGHAREAVEAAAAAAARPSSQPAAPPFMWPNLDHAIAHGRKLRPLKKGADGEMRPWPLDTPVGDFASASISHDESEKWLTESERSVRKQSAVVKEFEDEFGVSVALYFRTLGLLARLFLWLSVLSVPNLLLCYGGGRLAASGGGAYTLRLARQRARARRGRGRGCGRFARPARRARRILRARVDRRAAGARNAPLRAPPQARAGGGARRACQERDRAVRLRRHPARRAGRNALAVRVEGVP